MGGMWIGHKGELDRLAQVGAVRSEQLKQGIELGRDRSPADQAGA
jgi:hypothetical protein